MVRSSSSSSGSGGGGGGNGGGSGGGNAGVTSPRGRRNLFQVSSSSEQQHQRQQLPFTTTTADTGSSRSSSSIGEKEDDEEEDTSIEDSRHVVDIQSRHQNDDEDDDGSTEESNKNTADSSSSSEEEHRPPPPPNHQKTTTTTTTTTTTKATTSKRRKGQPLHPPPPPPRRVSRNSSTTPMKRVVSKAKQQQLQQEEEEVHDQNDDNNDYVVGDDDDDNTGEDEEEIRYFEPIKYNDDDDDDDDDLLLQGSLGSMSLHSAATGSSSREGSVSSSVGSSSNRSNRSNRSGKSLRSSNRSNNRSRSRSNRSNTRDTSTNNSGTTGTGRRQSLLSSRSSNSSNRSIDSKGRKIPKNLPPPPPRRIIKKKKKTKDKNDNDRRGMKDKKKKKKKFDDDGGGHSSLTSLRHHDEDDDDDDDDGNSSSANNNNEETFHQSAPGAISSIMGRDDDDEDGDDGEEQGQQQQRQQEQERKMRRRVVSPRVIPRSPSGHQILSSPRRLKKNVVVADDDADADAGAGDGADAEEFGNSSMSRDLQATYDDPTKTYAISPRSPRWGGTSSTHTTTSSSTEDNHNYSPPPPTTTTTPSRVVRRTPKNYHHHSNNNHRIVSPATTFHTGGPSELPLTSNHEQEEKRQRASAKSSNAAKSSLLSTPTASRKKPSLRTTTTTTKATPRTPKTPKTPKTPSNNKTPRWGSTAADSPTKMNKIGITPMEMAGMHDTLRVFPSLKEVVEVPSTSSSTPTTVINKNAAAAVGAKATPATTPHNNNEKSSKTQPHQSASGVVNTIRTAPKLKKKNASSGGKTVVGSGDDDDGRTSYHKDVLVPFYGRTEEMKVIAQCLARVSMTIAGGFGTAQQLGTNPSEVLLMGGPVGVGKATIMKETIRRFVQSNNIDGGSSHMTNVIYARGHTERNEDIELYLPSSAPLHGLQRALCDLVDRVLAQQGSAAAGRNATAKADMSRMVWKARLKEALGGELHFLAVQTGMVPSLSSLLEDEDADHIVHTNGDRVLLQQQKRQPPRNIPFDTNTPQRLQRLSLAIRDLIQTIAEYHPVCFHMENIDHVDDDTWSILQYLFADEMKLKNVLLVGTYHYDNQILDFDGGTSVISTVSDDPEVLVQKRTRNVIRRFEQKLKMIDEVDDDGYESHYNDPKPSKMTKIYVEPFNLEQVEELLCGVLIDDPTSQSLSLPPAFDGFDDDVKKNAVNAQLDKIQETAKILYDLTGGNSLHVVHALRLFNDEKLLRVAAGGTNSRWDWSTEAIKEKVESWNIANSRARQGLEGLIQTRVQQHTTLEVRVILAGIASLQQTYFTSMNLYRVLSIAYKLDKSTQSQWDHSAGRKFQHQFDRETLAACPFKNEADVDRILLQACGLGFLKRLSRSHDNGSFPYYAFSHDMIRLSVSLLLPKKIKHGVPRDLQIHCMMGIELSAMASEDLLFGTVGTAGTPNSQTPSLASPRPLAPPNAPVNSSVVVGSTPPEERERYKFLAADQLMRSGQLMTDYRTSLCLYMVECAEICAVKSAFQTSILYVDTGLGLLIDQESEEDAHVDAIGIMWTKENYPVLIRSYMQLAKMRLACGQLVEANDACDTVLHNAKNLKDRFPAILLHIQLLMAEGRYSDAQEYTMHNLDEYGEKLPRGGWSEIVEREMLPLRQMLSQKTTHALLHPPKMIDKKTIDKMSLLGALVEICSICQRNNLREMATIRMMQLSVNLGFTRLYPFAFSYFAVSLNQRAINTDDADLATEAQRFGMIGSKLARLSDYYGGHSVNLYHWHVAHWRRAYKRSLEPVLQCYNAQFDAGDYFHLPMTIFTYSQLHLASGYDLAKLEENMELFSGLYADFQVPDEWRVRFPRRLVMNLMGETAEPLLFVGSTEEEEKEELDHMLEDPSSTESLQHLYFLKLYAAIFFNDYELAQDCLSRLPAKVEGVWVPWFYFFQCLVLISRLPGTKGKARKELKENIEDVKGQLIDWYNQGAPNPNAMISLIEAEYEMACNAGKDAMSGLKIQKEFAAVIEASKQEELLHLEALAYERAGMHFEHAGVDKWCTEYLMKAHSCYDRWNAMAKVIDLENRYSRRLRVGQRRKNKQPAEDAAAYRKRNENLRYDSDRKIGGGQKEIKPINIKKAVTKTTSKVKNFLSPRHLKEKQDDFSQEDMDNLQFDLDDDEYNPSSDDDDDGWIENDDDDDDDSTDSGHHDASAAGRKSFSPASGTPSTTKKKQTNKKTTVFGANLKSPFRAKKKKA